MGWKFEKVFHASMSTPKQIAFDGKYVWVTGSSSVNVYEYWGETSFHETTFENMDQTILNKYDGKLVLIATITIAQGSYWIVRGNTSMFIANAANFTKVTEVNIETREILRVISTPSNLEMVSNLHYECDKLWMVEKAKTDQFDTTAEDRQYLHFYNIKTRDWGSTAIPTRKSTSRTWIDSPYNGFVYITNFNNVAISKFNAETGAFVTSIRVNALPTKIHTTPYRNLYVSSYGGMLSEVDSSTNAVTHPFSTMADALNGIASTFDNTYFWFINTSNRLTRMKKSDKTAFFTYEPGDVPPPTVPTPPNFMIQDDYKLEVTDFQDTAFDQIMITPQFTYQNWNGSSFDTITVKPYVFIIGSSKLMAFRLDRPLYRGNNINVHSQSMISTGVEDYMGEIG